MERGGVLIARGRASRRSGADALASTAGPHPRRGNLAGEGWLSGWWSMDSSRQATSPYETSRYRDFGMRGSGQRIGLVYREPQGPSSAGGDIR